MEANVIPTKFKEALLSSLEENQFTFLSAGPGWGKTSVVQSLLASRHPQWVSIRREEIPHFSSRETLIVLDNYHNLSPRAAVRVVEMFHRATKRQQFVLLSRAPLPEILVRDTLAPCQLDGSDLAWNADEMVQFAAERVHLTEEQVMWLLSLSHGYPVFLTLLLDTYLRCGDMSQETEQIARKRLDCYLDRVLFHRLKSDAQKLFLTTAFFDRFTSELASQLTDTRWSDERLKELESSSGVLRSEQGQWTLSDPLFTAPCLRRKADALVSAEERRRIYRMGGDWYVERNELVQAVSCYEQAEDRELIVQCLLRNLRQDASVWNVARLRREYRRLTQEEVSASPPLLYGLCVLDALDLNEKGRNRWRQLLQAQTSGSNRDEALQWLSLLDTIGLPGIRGGQWEMCRNTESPSPCSYTSGTPSVLHGFWDLSDTLSQNAAEFSAEIFPDFEEILGSHGVGIQELLLAERRLERGEDLSSLFLQWYSLHLRIQRSGTLDMEFACVTLIVRALCATGQLAEAVAFLARFRARAEAEGGEQHLMKNIDALNCRLSLLEDGTYASRWRTEQRHQEDEPFLLDKYRQMTMVRCDMRCGEYPLALLRLGRAMEYLAHETQPLDQMETLTLTAVCCFRAGSNEWKPYLKQAIEIGRRYGYTTVLCQEGAALLPLLERMMPEYVESEYWNKIVAQTHFQSECFPKYLQGREPGIASLTAKEQMVLRMVCRYKTNAEIGQALGMQRNTVKSHLHNLFMKLGVHSREQARQAAAGAMFENG